MIEILITHHKPEVEHYLNHAIMSAKWQTLKAKITLITDAPLSRRITDQHSDVETLEVEKCGPGEKANLFLSRLNPSTKYTMLLSNDVVLSKNAVEQMFYASEQMNDVIQSPLSNNEYASRFLSTTPYFKQAYEYEEIDPIAIRDYEPRHGLMFKVPWISFYSPWISVNTWNKVGSLDIALNKSHNDVDFCYRANRKDIYTFVNANAYALHYGSKTTKTYMNEGDELACKHHFMSKWTPQELVSING